MSYYASTQVIGSRHIGCSADTPTDSAHQASWCVAFGRSLCSTAIISCQCLLRYELHQIPRICRYLHVGQIRGLNRYACSSLRFQTNGLLVHKGICASRDRQVSANDLGWIVALHAGHL